ncbi:MAG: phosphoribosylformylglycinamidine cyclo-ligase [Candidatus Coatesbacteria bacterium]
MKRLTYRSAGVDIAAGDAVAEYAKRLARARRDPQVVAGVGGFGALYRVPMTGKRPPLLVSGTDSVGTKLKLAFRLGVHDTVGIDCVAMCANDVACQGAQPLFFLDYIGIAKLTVPVGKALLRGVEAGCADAGCSLIGGETAELPGLYRTGEYDLVGFCVGAVEEAEAIDGSTARPGDVVIGVGSSGLHSNGYSLVNRLLLDRPGLPLRRTVPELGCSLAEELLRPTRIYVRTIRKLMRTVRIRALGHITGGALPVKAPRQLPRGLGMRIETGTWPVLPIFSLIERLGRIERREMFRTFNMGLGLTVVVRKADAEAALQCLLDAGERAQVVGNVVTGKRFTLAE